MDLKQFFDDDDAVSPVIGVILMVAITVILAAVIATFVLGLGDSLSSTAPQATFSYDFEAETSQADDDQLSITHNGGDSLTRSNIQISIAGTDALDNTGAAYKTSNKFNSTGGTDVDASIPGGPVTAGDAYVIEEDNSNNDVFSSGDTARVIWTSSQGGDSAIISSATI